MPNAFGASVEPGARVRVGMMQDESILALAVELRDAALATASLAERLARALEENAPRPPALRGVADLTEPIASAAI